MTIDTTPRAYRSGNRPRVIIRAWEDRETRLTSINSKTAYFRCAYFIGEMAIPVSDVIEIREDDRA